MLLLVNGKVLTFNDNSEVIDNGGVLIKGEKIKDIGKSEELKKKYSDVEIIDVSGKVIMPGMINSHMHFYSTFARGMDLKTDIPPQDFVDILEKLWWRLDENMNEEDIYYSTIFALLSSIKNGTTTIFDHHASYGLIEGSLDIIAEAVKKAGLRANLSYEISDRNGNKKRDKALRENERFIKKLSKDNDHLKAMIGLHASFTLSSETLEKVASLKEEIKSPIHIHAAEGYADVKDSKEKGYKGVIDRLNHYNLWDPESMAIHGVHLQRDEFDILKEHNVNLIHNPQSNMGNAVGAAPIIKAFEKGINVGLGTDGYTTDMFESLGVASILQSHEQGHPSKGGEETFKMAFANNQKIASKIFNNKIGKIEKEAMADLIIVDYNSPTPVRSENTFGHVLMGFNGGIVDSTIVGGKVLMKNREVKIFDEERIYQKCREQAEDFWKRF